MIIVRPDSFNDQYKIAWLCGIANNMLARLDYLGYKVPDGVCRIWLKEYQGVVYPKVEFSFEDLHEELQYEVDNNGNISEFAFKKFIMINGKYVRVDREKKDMCLDIKYIDTVLREKFD